MSILAWFSFHSGLVRATLTIRKKAIQRNIHRKQTVNFTTVELLSGKEKNEFSYYIESGLSRLKCLTRRPSGR